MVLVAAFSAAVSGNLYPLIGGLVFGIGIGICFAALERRDLVPVSLFVVACTLASPLALIGGWAAERFWFGESGQPMINVSLPSFFVGGLIGGLMILGAALPLFSAPHPSMPYKILGGTLACGCLALIGGALDHTQSKTVQHWSYMPLVWQPGTALLLGSLLYRPGFSEEQDRPPGVRYLRGMAVFLGVLAAVLIGLWILVLI